MNEMFSTVYWQEDIGYYLWNLALDYTGAGNAPMSDYGMHRLDVEIMPVDLSLAWLYEAESHCCVVESKRRAV